MDRSIRERFSRMRQTVITLEENAENGKWDSALTCALALNDDAAFLRDWVRVQARPHQQAEPGADTWEPPAQEPLENITEPLAGTLDADQPVPR